MGMNLKQFVTYERTSKSIPPKVGMRLRPLKAVAGYSELIGKICTICTVGESFDQPIIKLRFDEPFAGGHDCGGFCEWMHGRNVKRSQWDNGDFEIIG